MLLVQRNDVVGALTPDRANHALREGIRFRRPNGCQDRLDADPCCTVDEVPPVARVTVTDQVLRRDSPRGSLNDLAPDPRSDGMGGHIEVNDATAIVAEHDKHVQRLKPQRRNCEEVAGPDLA